MQCSWAGPWLTVSTLFPLVPQSTILSTDNNLSIHSLTFPSFQSTWKTSKNHGKKKLKCPGRKPSIAQRNSLFKCKTKISGLFSMPMRLHREQCSQWTFDRKKGKSFLGIKRHCVVERQGASKRLGWCTCTHTQKHAYSMLRYWEFKQKYSPKTYVGSVQSVRPTFCVVVK